jgi:hypothetical protein
MTTRDRLVLVALVLAALVAAGWFLVLAPQREEASGLAGQIATQRQTLNSALPDVAAGLAAKRSYAHDYATVAQLGAAVPDDDNVASLLVQLQQAAQASKIDFRSLTAGSGSAAGAVAPAPPAPTPTTPGAPATQAATATLPPGAAVGLAGFPTMPFSFTFTGDFFRLSDFVGRMERFLVVRNRSLAVGGRFMTVDGIALSAAPEGFPHVKASVAATTYLLPATQGLTNGATSGGPAAVSDGGTGGGVGGTGSSTGGVPAAPAAVVR